jgi:hypothetical protein
MKRRCFAVVLAALLVVGACDHVPVDPLDPRVDITSLLASDAVAADHSMLAMPGLLHAAVRKVYTEQGIAAVRTLIAQLQVLHEQAEAARSDGDDADTAELQRLHAEEVRIILYAFGDALAGRVLDEVRADVSDIARSLALPQPAGRPVPHMRAALVRIEALLEQSAVALAQGDAASALAAAGRAANETARVRRGLATESRLPTLGLLFDDALDRLRLTDPYMAERAVEKYAALERASQHAVQATSRDRAHATVDALRRDRIEFVLSVLGTPAVQRMLVAVGVGYTQAQAEVAAASGAGQDVYRLERMLKTADDLYGRADRALASGDVARALDLGSHAADLLNTIRLHVPSY